MLYIKGQFGLLSGSMENKGLQNWTYAGLWSKLWLHWKEDNGGGVDSSKNQSNKFHKWFGLRQSFLQVHTDICHCPLVLGCSEQDCGAAIFLVSRSQLGGLGCFFFVSTLSPVWPVPSPLHFQGMCKMSGWRFHLSFVFKVFVRRCSLVLFPVVASVWSAGSWRPPPPHGRGSATCSSVHTDTCWTDRWVQTPGRTYCFSRQRSRQTGSTERKWQRRILKLHSVWLTLTSDMFSSLMSFMGQ